MSTLIVNEEVRNMINGSQDLMNKTLDFQNTGIRDKLLSMPGMKKGVEWDRRPRRVFSTKKAIARDYEYKAALH